MEAHELMNRVLKSTLFRQKRRSWEFVKQRALSLFRLVSAFRICEIGTILLALVARYPLPLAGFF